jgi:hypothetical protein
MHDVLYQSFGCYVAVDQLSVSRRAAKSAELLQAVRERQLERRAQRKHRRAVRRGREAYTTAV